MIDSTMTDAVHDLLDAVDALTLPSTLIVVQPVFKTVMDGDRPRVDEHGNPVREIDGTQKTRIRHEALLDQLEAAISGSMNTVAGDTATLAFTRGMLDSDALYQFLRIQSMILDWKAAVKAPHRETTAAQLRAWYTVFVAEARIPAKVTWHARKLRDWVKLIEDKLDPYDEYVQPDPCPNPDCPQGFDEYTGRPTWWDPKSREARTDPLRVQFRRADGARLVEKARARCGACGTVWTVRALAWELERKRHAEA